MSGGSPQSLGQEVVSTLPATPGAKSFQTPAHLRCRAVMPRSARLLPQPEPAPFSRPASELASQLLPRDAALVCHLPEQPPPRLALLLVEVVGGLAALVLGIVDAAVVVVVDAVLARHGVRRCRRRCRRRGRGCGGGRRGRRRQRRRDAR